MYIYTVEYLDDEYNRVSDYVLAENDNECMDKFNKHHPDEDGFIVDWETVNY